MKQRFKSFAIVALIIAATIGLPLTVNAIDRATIRRYAENNILFYNPESTGGCSSTSTTAGSLFSDATPNFQDTHKDNAIKIMEEIIAGGYSPAAAAAIAGNIAWESGFLPCLIEGYSGNNCSMVTSNKSILDLERGPNAAEKGDGAGFGIVQWTDEGRKKELIKLADSKGASVKDLDIQTEHLVNELKTWKNSVTFTTEDLNNLAMGEDGFVMVTWRIYKYFEAPGSAHQVDVKIGGRKNSETVPSDPHNLDKEKHAAAWYEFVERRLPAALAAYEWLKESPSFSADGDYSTCTGMIGGIVYKQIDGHNYAFPHAGTTKKNYNKNLLDGRQLGMSPIASPSVYAQAGFKWSGNGIGGNYVHHDYPAEDIGRGNHSENGTAEGTPVVVLTDGTILDYFEYNEGYKGSSGNDLRKCAGARLEGKDGRIYVMLHMSYDEQYEGLDNKPVTAGTPIGTVGPSKCAGYMSDSAPHTHIDERGCDKSSVDNSKYDCVKNDRWNTWYSTHVIDVISQLYEGLPEE